MTGIWISLEIWILKFGFSAFRRSWGCLVSTGCTFKICKPSLMVARKTTVKVISANLLTKAKTAIAQAFTVNFATALA